MPRNRAFESHVAIDRLGLLKRGWNSYNAPLIAEKAREHAKGLVAYFTPRLGTEEPKVGPTPEGGVVLIWEFKNGMEFEIEVDPSGLSRFALLGTNGFPEHQGVIDDRERKNLETQLLIWSR